MRDVGGCKDTGMTIIKRRRMDKMTVIIEGGHSDDNRQGGAHERKSRKGAWHREGRRRGGRTSILTAIVKEGASTQERYNKR